MKTLYPYSCNNIVGCKLQEGSISNLKGDGLKQL